MEPLQASVGIVIRTRDRALFLRRALASVKAQTYSNWQIALINDGGEAAPVDAALAALFDADETRVLPRHLPASIGRSAAFNHGVAMLETDFIACLDDDDTWDPMFLEALLRFHQRTITLAPDLGGVASQLTAIREDVVGTGTTARIVTLGEDELSPAFRRGEFFLNPIAYASYRQDVFPVQWLLHREAVQEAGGFPVDFSVMEDRAFMTRFLEHRQLAILDQRLAFHHRRTRRHTDQNQSVELNTMDNPSYDWRLYADLARVPVHSPRPARTATTAEGRRAAQPEADPARIWRAIGTNVVKEINDETSALWHKIDGEAQRLRARIDSLEQRLNPLPATEPHAPPAGVPVYEMWSALGAADLGHTLAPGHPFAGRFELSQNFTVPGLLLHVSPVQRQFVVQLPQTRDWSAIEFCLDGLAGPDEALTCTLVVQSDPGYLFETALSQWLPGRRGKAEHRFAESHVHSCPPGGSVHIMREFPPSLLAAGERPRLSVILPRQAVNFQFRCADLAVYRH